MFHPKGPTFLELARQALSSTDRGYDLLAPKFEFTPFRTPDAVLEVAMAVISEGGVPHEALDLCCGTGAAMRHLRRVCTGRVVGVDRSPGMLREARQRLPEAEGRAQVLFVRGDALALPFGPRFDVATCFGAFGHVLEEDEPALVREVARVLRPGGRFVFATSDVPSRLNPALWMAKGFNAAMRIRNALIKPEFVMYYLTFLLPRARALLESEGFELDVRREVFPKPYRRLVLVVATKKGGHG